MDFNNLFDIKNFPSDETLEQVERDGRAKKIDEAIAKAQAQVEGLNANLAEIDNMLNEGTDYHHSDNDEKKR